MSRTFKPATKFFVKKLKRNGPKNGQSVRAYLYGRSKQDEKFSRKLLKEGWIPTENLNPWTITFDSSVVRWGYFYVHIQLCSYEA